MFILPLALILLAVVYVYWHIWTILPLGKIAKTAIVVLLVLPSASMFLGFGMGGNASTDTVRLVQTVGTSWLLVLLYLLMTFIAIDIVRLIAPSARPWFSHSLYGSLGIVLLMIGIFTYGNTNYRHKKKVMLNVSIDKPVERPLRIIGISDLHLGYTIGRDEAAEWVDMINEKKPDMVLIAGDIVDSDVTPNMQDKVYEELKRINAPLGVYACLGNHDYYAGVKQSAEFMELSGITLLKDTAVPVDNRFYVIGRDDRTNPDRKSLDEIVSGLDKDKPMILLDHQPYNLEEARNAGIDLQLSGHTHNGQVFPINLITCAIYECSYGFTKKGKTNIYVSSGIGIWGGKFRIGTDSEFVVFNVTGNNAAE